MEQAGLFHESLEEALGEVVRALGGRKRVAMEMWPTKSARDAHNHLDAVLNPTRPEKFGIAELLWLVRRGREARCHAAMAYISEYCGYADPTPVDPADKQAQLQEQFVQSVRWQAELIERLGIDHKLPAHLRGVK